MSAVFDRPQIARQRNRAAPSLSNHNFLIEWTMKQLAERLDVVRRTFPVCVQIGARGMFLADNLGIETQIVTDSANILLASSRAKPRDLRFLRSACGSGRDDDHYVVCEEDFFPFANRSLDLVVSALNLHTVNDLPGALLQINRSLKKDGLFIAGLLGGETLRELRECLNEAELELSGGVTPRVAPFADKPQMGLLLQRAGFSLPVVDSEIVTVTYDSIFPLMRDLRLMGEGNAIAARSKHFTRKSLFLRAGELYAQKFSEPDGRIVASFEIIFVLGWAPHESQQQPLKPGSAQTRLADFLGTDEIGTGEKPN